MQLTKQKRGDCDILLVSGRLDGTTAPQFESELSAWLRQGGKNFVLDLADVSFLSSAALRVLLSVAKRATREGGRVVLSSPGSVVREVFEISNFTALFTIFESLDEAVLGLGQKPASEGPVVPPVKAAQAAPKPDVTDASPAASPQSSQPSKTPVPPPEASAGPGIAPPGAATPARPPSLGPVVPTPPPVPVTANAGPVSPNAPDTPVAKSPLSVSRAPVQPVSRAKSPGLQVVVGTEAVRCRDGDILGREGTVAKHLFAELQPRHAMIGQDDEGWFLLVPKGVQAPTRLDDIPIPAGVRQHLTGEHRLSVGAFSASLRLVGGAASEPKASFLSRFLRLIRLGRQS